MKTVVIPEREYTLLAGVCERLNLSLGKSAAVAIQLLNTLPVTDASVASAVLKVIIADEKE